MARSASSLLFSVLGFLTLGGGFVAGAVMVMQPAPPPPFAPVKTEPAAHDPAEMVIYMPIEEQLAVAVPEQPVRVMLTLGLSLRGRIEDLQALQAEVDKKRPAILALMLTAAQGEVVKTVDPMELLARLPGPLRKAVNDAVGTADLPEPVEEVLITGLVTQ